MSSTNPPRGRVADTALGKPETEPTRGELVVEEIDDCLVHCDIDPLEHRGQDVLLEGRVAHGLVLVGVDTDRPEEAVVGGLLDGCLEQTETRNRQRRGR